DFLDSSAIATSGQSGCKKQAGVMMCCYGMFLERLTRQRVFEQFEVTVTAHELPDSKDLAPGSDSHLC
ncbi:MAG: hypothetical protein KDE53_11015, partial [Caldilineaceae bacterium]|nr:hypothetical protein [Caldilineaceae bacterium]